jgi:hypothetical protein
MFIVHCNSREPEGISKITTATRSAALEVASDFLKQGMRFVTVVAQGRLSSDRSMTSGDFMGSMDLPSRPDTIMRMR